MSAALFVAVLTAKILGLLFAVYFAIFGLDRLAREFRAPEQKP